MAHCETFGCNLSRIDAYFASRWTFVDARGGRCALASAVHAIGRPGQALRNYSEWKWTLRSTACPECSVRETTTFVVSFSASMYRRPSGLVSTVFTTNPGSSNTTPQSFVGMER